VTGFKRSKEGRLGSS